MLWKGLNVIEILQIGVIGLGFLLALLAYHLLTKERKLKNPRPLIIRSIYVFMSFSMVLCLVGVLSQIQGLFVDRDVTLTFNRQDQKKSNESKRYQELLSNLERTQAAKEILDSELSKVKTKNAQLSANFKNLKEVKTENERLASALEASKKKVAVISTKLESISKEKNTVDSLLSIVRQKLSSCETEQESMTRNFFLKFTKLKGEYSVACQSEDSQSEDSTCIFPIEPFWLNEGVVERLADGRVLVVYYYGLAQDRLAVTSGGRHKEFSVLKIGSRFEFSYDNAAYFIDVLDEVKTERKILVSIMPAQ